MVTLTALSEVMKLGQFPQWSPNLTMRLGDELAETLQRGEPLPADANDHPALPLDQTAERIITKLDGITERLQEDIKVEDQVRDVLIDFGALDPEDDVTDPVDLLRALLPPTGA